jgi:hypothetical protein
VPSEERWCLTLSNAAESLVRQGLKDMDYVDRNDCGRVARVKARFIACSRKNKKRRLEMNKYLSLKCLYKGKRRGT